MTSHGQCPRGGCFPIFRRADDVTRTMSKGGGGHADNAPGVPPIQVQTPPPPPGWLATGLIIMVGRNKIVGHGGFLECSVFCCDTVLHLGILKKGADPPTFK